MMTLVVANLCSREEEAVQCRKEGAYLQAECNADRAVSALVERSKISSTIRNERDNGK